MQYYVWYIGEVFKEVVAKYSLEFVIMLIGFAVLGALLGIFTLAGFWGIFNKTGERGCKPPD